MLIFDDFSKILKNIKWFKSEFAFRLNPENANLLLSHFTLSLEGKPTMIPLSLCRRQRLLVRLQTTITTDVAIFQNSESDLITGSIEIPFLRLRRRMARQLDFCRPPFRGKNALKITFYARVANS